MNYSECSNPELRFRAASELVHSHSHYCPTHERMWLHFDPEGRCQYKRDEFDKPTKMLCPDCRQRRVILTDEGRDVPIAEIRPWAFVYPNKVRIEWKHTTYTVSRLSELRKLRKWLSELNPYLIDPKKENAR